MVGFGSLVTSKVPAIQEFGSWAAIGAALEWYIVFLLMPLLAKNFKFLRLWVDKGSTKSFVFLEKLNDFKLHTKAKAPLILAAILGLGSISFVNLNDSPDSIFSNLHPLTRSGDYLLRTRGWKANIQIEFSSRKSMELNQEVIDQISRVKNVQTTLNPYQIASYVSPAFDLNQATFQGLEVWFPKNSDLMRTEVFVKNVDLRSLTELKDKIDDICGENCRVYGDLVDYIELSSHGPKTLLDSLIVSILLTGTILIVLCLGCGQLAIAPSLFFSSIWGVCVTMLLVSLTQIEINFLSSIFMSILVGVCGDNTIQFLLGPRSQRIQENIDEKGVGAQVVIGITSLSGLVFTLSDFSPVRVLGLLLSMGLWLVLIGDLWVLRLLTKKES